MLNYLWAGMLLIAVAFGALQGNLNAVTQGILDSAKDAVSLGITMLGIMAFWSGILEVGAQAGVIGWMTEKMTPVLNFLFPKIPQEHPSRKHIATNMIANILGLGWAATPAGLRAMEELQVLEEERRQQGRSTLDKRTANKEMCTFMIINISSLQLIPINMIAYRSEYGSSDPMAIVGAALLATLASTVAGVIFSKLMDR